MTQPLDALVFREPALPPFDFHASVRSHGWVMLAPFAWDEDAQELTRPCTLKSGKTVQLRLRSAGAPSSPQVEVRVRARRPLRPGEEEEARGAVRRMLRLEEDLAGFHALRGELDGWNLRLGPGGGRLLRCPTLFEDVVCTLLTTNIAWSGTIRMAERLVGELGRAAPGGGRAFPTPAAIASAGPDVLRERVRLGYRAPYVWDLAFAVSEGTLDLEALEGAGLPTDDLRRELLAIKGVGPYGAATLLMILGRYEELAIDTELRAFVSRKYLEGQPPTDDQIQAIYAPWGAWKYLAYWFDIP